MIELVKGEQIEVLLTEEKIKERVAELAAEIARDYEGKPVTLLCTLKGAMFLLADLARGMGANVEIDFIKASSYGNRTKSDGVVQLEHFPGTILAGRHVLLVEDIIDSGYTVSYLKKYINEQGVASLKLCALLDKPNRREVHGISADYLGFTIPDEFVVGYGLDYAQRYRNLPYIGILHFVKE